MKHARLAALALAVCLASIAGIGQRARQIHGGAASITPEELRGWLSYISSGDLEGRNTFSEGLGLAAAYIAGQLKETGVKPAGDHGTYFQRVAVLGVKSTNRSTLTIDVNGKTRTFKDGEGITFPKNVGGKRVLTLDKVVFAGYGLNLSPARNDYNGLDVKGKAVVWLGAQGPRSLDPAQGRRLLRARTSLATDELGAAATIAPPPDPNAYGQRGFGSRGQGSPADFTTVQNLTLPVKPNVTGTDDLLTFLFSAADFKYADLKAKAGAQEDLPKFDLKGVKLTFNLDADYQIVNTQYTRNVVGMVDGSDPALKNTYVAFGAHYDHLGYRQGVLERDGEDRIFYGADDDGSGTTTLIALARALATGPKTKRSLLFAWHSGEERGLWGSRYMADYPVVPIDKIAAQLNIDMIGRNRDNKESEKNTVYVVGSDRISTELHNIMVDANSGLANPLTLDYELNDATDPERIYYRSDHFSYASKGIPIIFFTTGLHPDYHKVTDTVDKIEFGKMSHIGQLVYEIGRRVANLDHFPVRDFKGPRFGKGASGKISSN